MMEPISLRSSRSTEVMTACLMFIILMELATFSGSAQSTALGRPVCTPQKPHERVQIFPKIIKVAVPSAQHSPILGQLPEVQMVLSLYLSTNPLSSVYFFPVGSFTRIQSGFFWCLISFSCTSIILLLCKDTNSYLETQKIKEGKTS